MAEYARCPDCGTELPTDGATEGLCPQCLLSLALHDLGAGVGLDGEAETLDRPSAGRILGERYQMRERLGQGGMGEVWRAFDLKLRLDVALKAIRPDRVNERARELLRQEVRSAREVVSPNVCRIFDLVVEDGQELVSMELIDGATLTETLRVRGPLSLQEARDIASQFLSGLEAIHQAGLVHRDFKPENVMLTRAGRVVVMDFGLAKGWKEGTTGTIAGTPAYMAPEQARGEAVDARADVFSAGLVLGEMLVVGGEGGMKTRQALWKAAREVPPQVPESPWAPVLKQALAQAPGARPASARALARALEEVTLRLPGFEEKRPYPGLASFTEEDAEYFFGREVEVEAVLQKLKRPRLLALIGPSGAGKSSFLRAGLLPKLPRGFKAVLSTPGRRPFQALAQALAPSLSGDTQAVQALLRFEEADEAVALFRRFRQGQPHVLVVVDQFEELFTLNPTEAQKGFAELLGRLVLEADVHVLLSLRDDFLFHCNRHEALGPAFSDLTPLGPLRDIGLRRALVQPALACGYRFEDEALVDEMVGEVGHERGALPLLAFAASRLWERRDREKGLLTRQSYEEIGGVGGALAQHAEATLETIGTPRAPVVRELFRNLITSQGTRAARERVDLLSVFGAEASPERVEAAGVLDALIGARLLTAYERPGEDGKEGHQEVEVIHESLLANWPRLVRWQTQDADGAQLRDQLRQAAQVWQDRGRAEDLLWSGTAYRDFALWRERYPGGLSATEEAFAEAAARRAGRRRRQRRIAAAALVAALSLGLGVVAAFWGRAETSRQKAEAAALRAEASKLLALGQLELDRYPTAALAYATRSLEVADSEEARRFALRVLQRAPSAIVAPANQEDGLEAHTVAFSPTGEWLAAGGYRRAQLLHRDGREPRALVGQYASAGFAALQVGFARNAAVLVTNRRGDVRLWSVGDGREIGRVRLEEGPSSLFARDGGAFTATTVGGREAIDWLPLDGGEPRRIGQMNALRNADIDAAGTRLAYTLGPDVYLRSLTNWALSPRLVARYQADVERLAFGLGGTRLAASDASGEIRIWPTEAGIHQPLRVLDGKGTGGLRYSPGGRWLVAGGEIDGTPRVHLWDLDAPPGTEPLFLQSDSIFLNDFAFEPDERWLVTANVRNLTFWALAATHPRVLRGHEATVQSVAFTPDGELLLSASNDGTLRAWPIKAESRDGPRVLLRTPMVFPALDVDSRGRRVVVTGAQGHVFVVPVAAGQAHELKGFSTRTELVVTLSPDGRFVAAAPYQGTAEDKVIRVWDLESDEVQILGPTLGAGEGFDGGISALAFLDQDRIVTSNVSLGVALYDRRGGGGRVLSPKPNAYSFAMSRTGRFGLWTENGGSSPLSHISLDGGGNELLPSHPEPGSVALDPSEALVATGGSDGVVRVGPLGGGEPHLFFGHGGLVRAVAFSPDGRWLASAGDDKTIRLWPVPDVSKTPLHKRSYEELLATLRSSTNLRAVPDARSASGYKIEAGPFPGWARAPEW